MGIYRKPGKQEAYNAALGVAGNFSREFLFESLDALSAVIGHIASFELDRDDAREVAARAIRTERDRRIGKNTMTKKSFDLSAADCGMLAELQTELGHSTEVAALRAAIHALYARTFG